MIHLRMVAPPALAERVLAALERKASVINVIHLPGAARSPSGDVILCDVAREDASVVLAELRDLGLAEQGTIAIETVDTAISTAARAAEHAAAGSPSDAVVWEEVESRTSESAELSGSFLAFMVLATLIAGVGILTDSVILIIGAMVVGPEFGPLAGVCVALVHRRLALARRSLIALAVGFPVAIAATYLGTLLLRAADRGPDELADHPATLFISQSRSVLRHRRRARRHRRRALALDREVRRPDRRPDLGHDDPRRRERRRRRRLPRLGRVRRSHRPTRNQPDRDRRCRRHDARNPARLLPAAQTRRAAGALTVAAMRK